MLILSAEQIRSLVNLSELIDCLREGFREQYLAPPRQLTKVPGAARNRLLLFMPAFDAEGSGVVKLSTVYPDNEADAAPTIQAVIVVFSKSGAPIGVLDGTVITQLRTAAASALASSYLSRPDSSHLVIIGTGALAPAMAAAHCAARPITQVTVCGRRADKAAATVEKIRSQVASEIDLRVASCVQEAVATADIVSCATSSPTPLIAGKWLRAGTFVDVVGSFSPARRESDDDAILRSRVFVDTFEGALAEAGDILQPLARGVIDRRHIEGELADLVCGRASGRRNMQEITLFKSVGSAIEDLAATRLVLATAGRRHAVTREFL